MGGVVYVPRLGGGGGGGEEAGVGAGDGWKSGRKCGKLWEIWEMWGGVGGEGSIVGLEV